MENLTSILHSDSATYYKDSARLRQFCAKKGIRQTFSPPYTQALNAIAERCIRTIVEMARTSLNASGLQIVYYGEALMYAITVLNNLPQKKNKGWTPEELWQGRKHSYPIHTKLKPFGCAAWVLNLRQSRRKFDQKSELQICLNYNPDSHAYRLDSYRFRKAEYQKVHTSHSTSTIFPWPRRIRRQDPTTGLLNTQSTHTTTIPHSRNTSDQPETGRHQPKPSGT